MCVNGRLLRIVTDERQMTGNEPQRFRRYLAVSNLTIFQNHRETNSPESASVEKFSRLLDQGILGVTDFQRPTVLCLFELSGALEAVGASMDESRNDGQLFTLIQNPICH